MRMLFVEQDPSLLMTSSSDEVRPEGVHLSDILARMAWEKERKYHPDHPVDLQTVEQGFTWETVLGRALAARHGARAGCRPAPFQEDGVWCSPDWIGDYLGEPVHEEWKATKKSVAALDAKIQEWLPQAQCYVRGLWKRGLVARPLTIWRVWFIMGDWKFESGSKEDATMFRDYYKIGVEFEKRDLEERWRSVIAAGQKYGLLKGEARPWDNRPRLNQTVQRRLASGRRGNPPTTSPTPSRVVTFPRTRTSWRRPGGS